MRKSYMSSRHDDPRLKITAIKRNTKTRSGLMKEIATTDPSVITVENIARVEHLEEKASERTY